MKRIKSWSFSTERSYRECPLRVKFAKIDKIPEPERPARADGKEHANDRGTRVHDSAEAFIRGKIKTLPHELKGFKEEFEYARELFKCGVKMNMEEMWCFDENWVVVEDDHPVPWLRVKLDLMVWDGPIRAILVDYKTGQRKFNEIKHGEQTQLYQLAAFMRFPRLQEITTELWYPDVGELVSTRYRRAQGMRYMKMWNQRGLDITSADVFPARPSEWNCRFCSYKTGMIGKSGAMGTGHCNRNP